MRPTSLRLTSFHVVWAATIVATVALGPLPGVADGMDPSARGFRAHPSSHSHRAGADTTGSPGSLWSRSGAGRGEVLPAADSLHGGTWIQIPVPGPTPRDGASLTHDPVRDRYILFGGYDRTFWLNDLWQYRPGHGHEWSRIVASGEPPPPRTTHSAVFDPVRDRLVVFGGQDRNGRLGDCWELALTDPPLWTRLEPQGPRPAPRAGHVAVHDPLRQRMMVFGGNLPGGGLHDYGPTDEVWSLALADPPVWTLELPVVAAPGDSGPCPRLLASAAVDASRNRMVIFGGAGGWTTFGILDDGWALELGDTLRWSPIAAAGTRPGPRDGQNAVYDGVHDRMVMFGGNDGPNRLDEVWALSLATHEWSRLAEAPASAPTPRFLHAGALDAARRRMIVFGGIVGPEWLGDTWSFDLAQDAWSPLIGATVMPPGRGHAAFALDEQRDRLLIFGGFAFGLPGNDLWALSLSDYRWTPIQPAGPSPLGRAHAASIYDPVRDRMVIFGGARPEGSGLFDDVWALSLGANPQWTQLVTAGTAPGYRSGSAAVYDPAGDRMIVYGGMTQILDDEEEGTWISVTLGDAHALSLGPNPTWTAFGTVAPGRAYMAHAHDPEGDRLMICGGLHEEDGNGEFHSDLYSLSLGSPPIAIAVEPDEAGPALRSGARMVMSSDELLLFGGEVQGGYLNDLWSYSINGAGEWRPVAAAGEPPLPRQGSAVVWDELRGRMIVYGGWNATGLYDAWVFDPQSSAVGVPAPLPAHGLRAFVQNPARGGRVWMTCELPAAQALRVRVYDVAGRALVERSIRPAAPGTQRFDLADGVRLGPGLYFVRAEQEGRSVTRRFCVLD